MAILSDYTEEEESKPQQPQTPPQSFSGTLDPSKPLGFIQSALEFVAKFSPDFFGSDSSENEIAKVVKSVKKKVEVDAAAKKKLASDAAAAKKKVEAKVAESSSSSCSSSSTVDEEKKEESKYRVPNKANGLDLENYSWGQSLQEVNVTIPVPPGTISKLIVCKIKKNHLKVGVKGQPPIIDGELYKPVRPDDCFWSLEDKKAVSILLTKHDQMDWWRAVVKGEPEIDTLHHLLDADDFTAAPTTAGVRDARAMARMPADVKEYPNSYQFIIDMPGLKSSDIKVQIEDENVLVISGERKRIEDEKEGGVKYLTMERRVGKFMRKFALPENANVEAITAVCQDGVLTVTVEKLPPPEPKKPKTIEVKVA